MKKNDLLDDIIVLAVLGVPFFAVRDVDQIGELKSIVKFKPRVVKNLTLISEPELIWLEEYIDRFENKTKKNNKWWHINNIMTDIVYLGAIAYYLFFHLIYRIQYKKQICEEEIKMFESLTSEILEHYRKKRIKLLAGIED